MAELVYQTWERMTGRPWSDAHRGGFTKGSYAENIALQKRLLGGWNPYAPAPAPAAPQWTPEQLAGRRKRAAEREAGRLGRAAERAKASAVGPVPVDPGLLAQQWEVMIAEQKRAAEEQAQLLREAQADARRLQEAQLSANPGDFVAYELYKRSLQEQGYTPQGAIRSDVEIQNLFDLALGLTTPRDQEVVAFGNAPVADPNVLGTGRFGVDIPTTQSISRSELGSLAPTDLDILSSFLRGGVEADGGFQGINPEDYFTELEEGLIPTLPEQRTQYIS